MTASIETTFMPTILAELRSLGIEAVARNAYHIEIGHNARTVHSVRPAGFGARLRKKALVVNRNQPHAPRFVVREDGTFNVKGLAQTLIRLHDAELDARPAREAAEAKHDAAVRLCEATKTRLGDNLHGLDLDASSQAGKVEIDLRMRSYTPDQIAQLHALLATFA